MLLAAVSVAGVEGDGHGGGDDADEARDPERQAHFAGALRRVHAGLVVVVACIDASDDGEN